MKKITKIPQKSEAKKIDYSAKLQVIQEKITAEAVENQLKSQELINKNKVVKYFVKKINDCGIPQEAINASPIIAYVELLIDEILIDNNVKKLEF